MTDLLHHPGNDPAPTPAGDTPTPEGIAFLDENLTSRELAALSNRHLRVRVNEVYEVLDIDHPPAGAKNDYALMIDELKLREQQARTGGPAHQLRETFRDNPLYCRFELIIDGDLAAYVKYTLTGGQLVLIDSVEQPGFRDQGLDATLMHHIVLNTHKRRLRLIPQCPMAFSFLANHPQYQLLVSPRLTWPSSGDC